MSGCTPREEVVEGGADPLALPHPVHRRLIENFLDAIERDREPPVRGVGALEVHALLDALLQSSTERHVVDVQA